MAVSRALRRLLRVLHLEEEESRRALDSSLGELHRLEQSLRAAKNRDRTGRALVQSSAHTGELIDRVAGIEESRAARQRADGLRPNIDSAEQDVTARREEFLSKRVERRQAQTLVEEAEQRDAIVAGRRSQRSLDDWYLNRLHREAAKAEAAKMTEGTPTADIPEETDFDRRNSNTDLP